MYIWVISVFTIRRVCHRPYLVSDGEGEKSRVSSRTRLGQKKSMARSMKVIKEGIDATRTIERRLTRVTTRIFEMYNMQ